MVYNGSVYPFCGWRDRNGSDQVNNVVFIFILFSELDTAKRNPFKMPPDNDIFMLRDKERQRKKFVSVFGPV